MRQRTEHRILPCFRRRQLSIVLQCGCGTHLTLVDLYLIAARAASQGFSADGNRGGVRCGISPDNPEEENLRRPIYSSYCRCNQRAPKCLERNVAEKNSNAAIKNLECGAEQGRSGDD